MSRHIETTREIANTIFHFSFEVYDPTISFVSTDLNLLQMQMVKSWTQ
jgi:hypothetical protein